MQIAFRTGGTVGLATTGLGLLGASVVVLIYLGDAPKVLEGFGFGAAMLAMFMRVGGGIFTKAADVGADLVGKVEQGIPEDDPRNAATIADNVGDNVGDCAGMAADLFESYAVTLVASLILGSRRVRRQGPDLPADRARHRRADRHHRRLHHQGEGRTRPGWPPSTGPSTSRPRSPPCCARSPPSSTCRAPSASWTSTPSPTPPATRPSSRSSPSSSASCWPPSSSGSPATSPTPTSSPPRMSARARSPVRRPSSWPASRSASSPPSTPRWSSARPSYGAFLLAAAPRWSGLFAIALAGCGLLTTVGVIVAMDTFGPVSDNAQGVAEMSGEVSEEGAQILTELDAVGNTTKAITKGIAIATAVLAATALFGSYSDAIGNALRRGRRRGRRCRRRDERLRHRRSSRPNVLVGTLLGAAVVFMFSGLAINAVSRAAGAVVFGGPPAVPRDPRDHGGHQQAGVRQGRRHRHPRFAAGADHPRPDGRVRPDRRRLRPRRRPAGRLPRPAPSPPAP